MPLELVELKRLHDKAYNSSQITRERAANDLVFYWVTQWDDSMLSGSQLAYRGEFNVLRKAGRQILSDLVSNPVQIDFEPTNETREDSAEVADGLYRADTHKNTSIEAFDNGQQEAVVCGAGAWVLHTEYASKRKGDESQVIRRKPIFEANNTVFWDPNSRRIDKSDAIYVSVLKAFSEDGYKNLVKKLTGEETEINGDNFKHPEHSYTFPWVLGEGKKIYVVDFYHITEEDQRIVVLDDPFGGSIQVLAEELEGLMDGLINQGYTYSGEFVQTTNIVTKYTASGERILKTQIVAGEHIPVVPIYGEHAIVEGEEHYEGVTRLTKDPQRLRNFAFSYLGDILSRSPRQKPIFFPEQVAGHEDMYSLSGADNNYPYVLANRIAGDGSELPGGPAGVLPEQPVPTALPAVLQFSREAVEDVANPGLPQDIAEPDISGKAVLAMQARLDMQSMVYQDHMKYAKRRDAEIYASIARVVYDVPRKVKLEQPDGTKKEVQIMEKVVDPKSGEIIVLHDITNAEFDIYPQIGPSYASQKEQTIDRIEKMIQQMPLEDPIRKALQLKQLTLMDGMDFKDIRDYANKQLVLQGVRQPQTEEEQQILEQASQQSKDNNPMLIAAMAEMKKGDADMLEQKRKGIEMQLKHQVDQGKLRIGEYEAETRRLEVERRADEAGVTLPAKQAENIGKELDNVRKIIDIDTARKTGTGEQPPKLAGSAR